MKLWIRSQERDMLEICNSLSMQPIITSNRKAETWGIISNFRRFGEYGTRERCLEILDEIQELLKMGDPQNAFYHFHNGDMKHDDFVKMIKSIRETRAVVTTDGVEFELTMPSTVVYEMPKD